MQADSCVARVEGGGGLPVLSNFSYIGGTGWSYVGSLAKKRQIQLKVDKRRQNRVNLETYAAIMYTTSLGPKARLEG